MVLYRFSPKDKRLFYLAVINDQFPTQILLAPTVPRTSGRKVSVYLDYVQRSKLTRYPLYEISLIHICIFSNMFRQNLMFDVLRISLRSDCILITQDFFMVSHHFLRYWKGHNEGNISLQKYKPAHRYDLARQIQYYIPAKVRHFLMYGSLNISYSKQGIWKKAQ